MTTETMKHNNNASLKDLLTLAAILIGTGIALGLIISAVI